jgi:hypothetical protein
MTNQKLKLEFIESGRMSDFEMNEIYGGAVFCSSYARCKKNNGKSTCTGGYLVCEDLLDPNKRNYCNSYSWIIGEEEFELFFCSDEEVR